MSNAFSMDSVLFSDDDDEESDSGSSSSFGSELDLEITAADIEKSTEELL